MAALHEINDFCDSYLSVAGFDDYCPNGLQVEACSEVKHIVSGVTASLALIEAAVEAQADLLLVHHGYFWKGEDARLAGMKGRRIRTLFDNNISLLAYHLPLDAHAEVGNNAQLAARLRWQNAAPLEEGGLVWQVELDEPLTACGLTQSLEGALGRKPLHIAGGPMQFRRIGWCTGAAQSYIETAARAGLDAFISGEVSEHTTHAARELGLHYFAAGHHATERYGVQALGDKLAQHFDVSHEFIEISNPV
ncbi:MAG: Nif3-like dinuclear metal center hexameric protein [Chromatiales bacterium]|jgi:dinuclear metal center YbgI/SA1388 family protein